LRKRKKGSPRKSAKKETRHKQCVLPERKKIKGRYARAHCRRANTRRAKVQKKQANKQTYTTTVSSKKGGNNASEVKGGREKGKMRKDLKGAGLCKGGYFHN